jgi:homoserine O-succinyltransferase/O-acetyltransferase
MAMPRAFRVAMMLTVNSSLSAHHLEDPQRLVIGLVNNMPDGALRSTEKQFRLLLQAASPKLAICLRIFSLPGIPRGGDAQSYVKQAYENIRDLWSSDIDGLIVTGAEPRTYSLADEPYWSALADLVEKAESHAISTIWSCLAAHGAVLHIDGIQRHPLREKLSGIFECTKAACHEIVTNAPSRWYVPHSRQNGLSEEALVAKGYRILSSSPQVGADMFVREGRNLFIFLQGHPEYDADALLREYRRDIRRFLTGESENYPQMPRDYFDEETTAEFAAFQQRAMTFRSRDLLQDFPQTTGNLACSWRHSAVRLYGNWLSYLVEHGDGRNSVNASSVLELNVPSSS